MSGMNIPEFGKAVRAHAMNAYGTGDGGTGVALLILNLATKWR
jgi:hypothetical protein